MSDKRIKYWHCIVQYYYDDGKSDLGLKLIREIIIEDSRDDNRLPPLGSLRHWLEEGSAAHLRYIFSPLPAQEVDKKQRNLLESATKWEGKIMIIS